MNIKILDDYTINLIAAGEVIENCSSIVKELIENSIDAKSKNILIKINDNDIDVIDDGIGMSKEDLQISTLKHSTSKINIFDDLFNLSSYGFRGEALSSIVNIAECEILSKKQNSDGNRLIVNYGKILNIENVFCNDGTHISIRNVFKNVPARLKFLNSMNRENLKIKDVVVQAILSNPNIKFELVINNKIILKNSAFSFDRNIIEIFGEKVLSNLIKIDIGYLGNINILKPNKKYMFTFFNNRFAKSYSVEKGIIDGYKTKLHNGSYPFVILNFDFDKTFIDVNVHPAKKIVKFSDESIVYNIVKNEIEKNIFEYEKKITSVDIDENFNISSKNVSSDIDENFNISSKNVSSNFNTNFSSNLINENIPVNFDIENVKSLDFIEDDFKYNEKMYQSELFNGNLNDYFNKNKFIGIFFNKFSVVECKDKIEIYDNHVVHERILYEKLTKQYYDLKISKQLLLIPIKITLTKIEMNIIIDHKKELNDFGFEIDEFGDNIILVRSVPMLKTKVVYTEIVNNIIEDILRDGCLKRRELEKIITIISCRFAIKSGDFVNFQDMIKLIDEINRINKFTCPHGRNVKIEISLKSLDKMFKRDL